MNDYENDTFRLTETSAALRMDRMLANADDFEDYAEWCNSLESEENYDEPLFESDWRSDVAMEAWDAHLETPW